MSYLILARKYRPQVFNEVYAQDHITKILKNTIEMDRIAQAYLFTGPRGVGKTSMARIFSKSLNCLENGPTTTPCNSCQNCNEITQGNSSDVIEIDGASNTGVDDIRDLQKELMYSPSNSSYKIYIIDEVHMLSKSAFNALLKTLEEPPENVIFIFATTEPNKVLPTIISRCQRFDFKRIPVHSIIKRLEDICEKENIEADKEALFLIAKKADGSMRDAQSLMDQIMAYGKEKILYTDVLSIFGIVPDDVYNDIMMNISAKEPNKIIKLLHKLLEKGNDIQEFLNGLLDYIRNLLMYKVGIEIPVISKSKEKALAKICSKFTENDLLYLLQLLIKTKTDIKNSNNPILIAEMAFVKIAKLAELQSIDKLLNSIEEGIKITETEEPQEPVLKKNKAKEQKNDQTKSNNKDTKKEEVTRSLRSLEELNTDIWEKNKVVLTKKLKKEKTLLGDYFDRCKLVNLSNNILTLKIGKKLGFNLLSKNLSLISDIISKHFDLNIKVNFQLDEKKNDDVIHNPDIEDIEKESPELARFIKETDSIIN